MEQVRDGGDAELRSEADKAAQFLEDLRNRVRPDAYADRPRGMNAYAVDFIPQPEITPADYDRLRDEAARFIARLQTKDTETSGASPEAPKPDNKR